MFLDLKYKRKTQEEYESQTGHVHFWSQSELQCETLSLELSAKNVVYKNSAYLTWQRPRFYC